jgi:alpha-tubulin suppressor-like RCC1 family protein
LCVFIFLSAPSRVHPANQIVAWGQNAGFGELSVPTGLTNVVAIAVGLRHNMALRNDGTVVTWGACPGSTGIFPVKTPEGLSNVIAIAAGTGHCLALKDDGTVVGWGYDGDDEIDVPADLTNVVAIAAGNTHNLALRSDGTLVTWGGSFPNKVNPFKAPAELTNVVAIACGGGHSIALKADHKVAVWGDNASGQTNVPPNLTNVVAIAAGSSYCLVVKNDGHVVGWGHDVNFGEVTPPADLTNVVAIAAGEQHRLALKSDGTLVAWGRGWGGTTVLPPDATNVIAISVGGYHNLVLKGEKETLHLTKKVIVLPPPHIIPTQIAQINWQAMGVVVAVAFGIINVIGWFVVHHLTKRRERQRDFDARMRDAGQAKSDFEAIIKKWLTKIDDRQQIALASLLTRSLPEIEQAVRFVRHHLTESDRARLDGEWSKYQRIDRRQLEGVNERHPVTGSTITSYDEARRVLSVPLKKMLNIIRPSGAFGPGDIPPRRPSDPNDPIDYDSLRLRPEDM